MYCSGMKLPGVILGRLVTCMCAGLSLEGAEHLLILQYTGTLGKKVMQELSGCSYLCPALCSPQSNLDSWTLASMKEQSTVNRLLVGAATQIHTTCNSFLDVFNVEILIPLCHFIFDFIKKATRLV